MPYMFFCGLHCKEKTSKGEGEGFFTALREKGKASRQINQRGNFDDSEIYG